MSSIQSRQLEGIFKVSNFVSKYQIDDVNSLLSLASCSMNAETMKKMKLCRLQEELQSLSIFAGYLMEKQFNVHLNWTSLSPSIVFLQKENHQPHIHADNETLDGKPKLNYENFDVSGVMYLSSTFGGGEIEFVHQNITIKPDIYLIEYHSAYNRRRIDNILHDYTLLSADISHPDYGIVKYALSSLIQYK